METTIGNSNPALWQYVKPSSVFEGIRSVVANRLAKSGYEWADTFDSGYNSGTYVSLLQYLQASVPGYFAIYIYMSEG